MISYFKNLLTTLEKSILQIDENVFNDLVDECIIVLKKSNKIVVSGLGKNVPICDKFVGTMLSLGLNANFLHTNSAVHGDMGVVKDGDLVIILTKSGETTESIYLAQLLQARNTNMWALTFNENSTLTALAKRSLVLSLDHEGDPWNIVPNNSTTLNLIVLQALAMQIAEKMDLQLDDFKRNHPGGHIGVVLKNDN